MGLFRMLSEKRDRNRVARLASEKRAEFARSDEKRINEIEDEWKILKEHESDPYMVSPDYDLDGFPFSNREYVCKESHSYDKSTGQVFTSCLTWYGDATAKTAVKKDVRMLESLIHSDSVGIEALPKLEADFSLVHAISKPRKNLPENAVTLTLNPPTPTGRNPKYPVTVRYSAYPDYPSASSSIEEMRAYSHDGSHGSICYFPDATIGRADVCFWNRGVFYGVHYRIINRKISVSFIEYAGSPSEDRITLYHV